MVGGPDVSLTQDDKTMAMLGHVLGIFSWIGPLVIYFVKRDSKFVAFHALQQLVWQISVFVVLLILGITIIGWPLIPIVHAAGWIVAVFAAIKAYNGEWYELPVVGAFARKNLGF
jgi:uncharacterized membrane protein